jgi:transcriptional regulator with XRE-family HTH domain
VQNEYISSEIAERIKLIAKSKGLTVSTVLKEVNLGRNTMANFKTSMPKADNLAKIADYLDCSIDYLMGRTDDPDLHKK